MYILVQILLKRKQNREIQVNKSSATYKTHLQPNYCSFQVVVNDFNNIYLLMQTAFLQLKSDCAIVNVNSLMINYFGPDVLQPFSIRLKVKWTTG